MQDIFTVNNESESTELAGKIAGTLKRGSIVAFSGDLGAGKTFFCRKIIQFLINDKINVISPTFNLLQLYDYSEYQIFHYDLYRLKHIDEIYELGIEEALFRNICLIEWPQLIKNILPADTINIDITIIDNDKRLVLIKKG